jgi:hypothetical protein
LSGRIKKGYFMALITFWRANQESKDEILKMNIEQILSSSGNGKLKDDSETSKEFREFLSEVEYEKLSEYARYCINNKPFEEGGQVLQDLVNEIGRRLDFNVENGRYRGVKNEIGFDGIWFSNNESLIIEVKTTNAYSIDLETPITYRDKLFEQGRVKKDTPILFVIGRDDTSSLEAQVRGSKHAWSIRIIGIDALIKLMEVNLSTLGSEVTEKIHTILRPFEYTRIDKIVDVVFTAAEDKNQEVDENETSEEQDADESAENNKSLNAIEEKRLEGISKLSNCLKTTLIKRRRTFYSDHSKEIHASIAISKRYEKNKPGYWYGYHTRQIKYLQEAKDGYMVYGMLDKETFFAIPFKKLEELKLKMDKTLKEKKDYWHIRFEEKKNGIFLKLNDGTEIDLAEFAI